MDVVGPRVSVIIPAYNAAPWIGEALGSVFVQTLTDYEVIVVDDGSTDGTPEVVRQFRGRVRYIWQPNKGVAAARNVGISNSTGELVAQLDADDLWLPEALEEMMRPFDDPDVGLVSGDIIYWNQEKPRDECPRHWERATKPSGRANHWRELLQRNFIPALATMVRRSVLMAVGPYDENLTYAEDYDMWLRIARAGYRFAFIDKLLGVYRLRPGSLTTNLGAKLDAHLYIGSKLLALHDLSPEDRELIKTRIRWRKSGYRSAAVNYLLAGDMVKARRYFARASYYYPFDLRNPVGLALTLTWPRLARRVASALRRQETPVDHQ